MRQLRIDVHHQHVSIVEARIDPHQLHEAADEQPRANQQHDRQRDFCDDQQAAQALATCTRGAGPSAVLERARQVGTRRLQRRNDPEEETGHQGRCHGRREHAQVEADRGDAREAGGQPGANRLDAEIREQDAERRATQGEHHPFDEQRAHQPPPARTERRPDSHLAAADRRPRQHQVGDVGARDQQHQRHRAEQHQHPATDASDEVLVQCDDAHAHPRAELGMLLVERHGHPVHLLAGLLDADTALQPAHRRVVVVAAAAADFVFSGKGNRPVDLGGTLGRHRIREPRRHHADDLERLLVDVETLADRVRRAAELPLPVAVAQDRDAMPAIDLVVGGELPAEDRRHAEHLEELVRDAQAARVGRLARVVAHAQDAVASDASDGVERLLHPSPVEKRLGWVAPPPKVCVRRVARAPQPGDRARRRAGREARPHRPPRRSRCRRRCRGPAR